MTHDELCEILTVFLSRLKARDLEYHSGEIEFNVEGELMAVSLSDESIHPQFDIEPHMTVASDLVLKIKK